MITPNNDNRGTINCFYNVFSLKQDYKNEASSLAEENVHLQNHIGNLEYDADLLIELINKARTTGKWEVYTKNELL